MREDAWLAFGLLEDAALPEPNRVRAGLPAGSAPSTAIAEARGAGNVVTWQWGDAVAAYTLVPRPLEWSALAGPTEAAWYWPQAESQVRRHAAHLIIALVDEDRDRVAVTMRLTQLVTAIAGASKLLAILWGPSGAIHEPAAFAEQAGQMTRAHLPLYLWIDFRVERVADDAYRLFTTGMQRLGCREIEVPSQKIAPGDLMNRAYNVAHYMLDRTRDIQDGDTLGLPDGAQATVRHSQSFLNQETEVFRLEFE